MPESDFYVQLVAIDGTLYFPKGGFPEHEPGKPFRTEEENVPSMLLRRYDAGDVDTIPWPMVSPAGCELRKIVRFRVCFAGTM